MEITDKLVNEIVMAIDKADDASFERNPIAHQAMKAKAVRSTLEAALAAAPASAAKPDIAGDNDGKEQDAFEDWAKAERYDMHQHPLHWLFMDKRTSAARDGWRAGIRYARKRALGFAIDT